jgi:hypothetical protein
LIWRKYKKMNLGAAVQNDEFRPDSSMLELFIYLLHCAAFRATRKRRTYCQPKEAGSLKVAA